jgi:riboflavin kinase / FMN adenylyltransferase
LKIIKSLTNFNIKSNAIVTIGTFDGVHIGHKKIIEKLVSQAKKRNCESIVLTFFPHPRMVLQQHDNIKLLNTIGEKSELLEKTGIDNLIIHPFDKEFSELSAEEFVKTILIDKLKIQKIIIGYDHRFGKNRSANIDDLIVFGEKYNFEVEQITVEEINQIAISSTKIRNFLLSGQIVEANSYLGYNYFISGKVVKGKQLGRTIGFPTANIHIEEDYKLLPKKGVYIVKSVINNKTIFGMMNIGNRPTLDGNTITIEVHFLNFDLDIYNENIVVEILDFIRDENKFDSLDSLKNQIEKDKQTTLVFVDSFS